MGWFDEQVTRTEHLASSKVVSNPENRRFQFGHYLQEHQKALGKSDSTNSKHLNNLRKEISFRVVNNILFRELEKLGGATKILALNFEEWEKLKQDVIEKIKEGLKQLRTELDRLTFDVGSSDKEKLLEMELLLHEVHGKGHEELTRAFEKACSY